MINEKNIPANNILEKFRPKLVLFLKLLTIYVGTPKCIALIITKKLRIIIDSVAHLIS
jgi:hypothetical protein